VGLFFGSGRLVGSPSQVLLNSDGYEIACAVAGIKWFQPRFHVHVAKRLPTPLSLQPVSGLCEDFFCGE